MGSQKILRRRCGYAGYALARNDVEERFRRKWLGQKSVHPCGQARRAIGLLDVSGERHHGNADAVLPDRAGGRKTLVMVGKFEEAEKLARACLALREKRYAANTYQVHSARATLGSALVGQKRYAEAEPLLAEGCAFLKQQDATAVQADLVKVQIKNRVASLVQLYAATGRPDKAAEWKKWTPRTATAPAPARPATPATPPRAAPATSAPATTPKP